MNADDLKTVLYEQLDRGQVRDFLKELTDERPSLKFPAAVRELSLVLEKMSPSDQRRQWKSIEAKLEDWEEACEDLGLPTTRKALTEHLFPTSIRRGGKGQAGAKKKRARSKASRGKAGSDLTGSGPRFVGHDEHVEELTRLIEGAEKEIVLVAYVLGPEFSKVQPALEDACDRGVRVTLHLDGREKSKGQGGKNRRKVQDLDERIRQEYGRIHAKCAVFDGAVTLLGSSNMDAPRNRIFQANVVLDDAAFARELLVSLDDIEP